MDSVLSSHTHVFLATSSSTLVMAVLVFWSLDLLVQRLSPDWNNLNSEFACNTEIQGIDLRG